MQSSRKILIVEDAPGIRNVHNIFFELQGFDVHTADEGRKAIALAQANSYDIIVLDLGLPDIDGLEVLRIIREFSSVPIIVMTARTDSASINASLRLGANEYMNKPFKPETLLRRIDALASRQEKV